MAKMEVLRLTPTERGELQSYRRKRNLPASVAQRMRIIVMLDEGVSYCDIEERLGAFRTRQQPPDGSTHWSLRKMAAVMKSARISSPASGKKLISNRIVWSDTWPPTIRSLKRRPPRSSACI